MRRFARPAIGVAALALVAVVASCGQQSPQNKAQQPQNSAQQPEPQAQQAQNKVQQPEPQQAQQPQNPPQQPDPQAQQAQNKVQQPEPQQVQQPQTPTQQPEPQVQQAQNKVPLGQPSANKNVDQNGSHNTAENLSEGEIRQIQQALQNKGFRVGFPDGILGPMTKRALSQFQRKEGLRQTSVPDAQTLAALGIGGGASSTGQGPTGSDGMESSEAPGSSGKGR